METQLEHQEISNTQHPLDLVIIADQLHRPANYGMLIRMAESMGVRKVHFVSDNYTTLTTKMRRSSRSAEHNLDVSFNSDSEMIQQYKNDDYTIIGLEYTSKSVDINNFNLPSSKIVLLIGNESIGLSDEWIQQSDICLHLPMYGKNSSMNVVVASSIALWTLIHST